MNYWLSRDDAAAPEGPYSLAQLKTIVRSQTLGAGAMACRDGEANWRSLTSVLADPVPVVRQEMGFAEVLRHRDEESVQTWGNVAGVLMFLTGLASMVPVLGLLMWFAYGLVALICTVLAVMMMVKGAVGRGILTIIMAWIGLPLAMFVGQVFIHALFGALTRA